MKFPKLEKKLEDAKKALGDAVRKKFPIGTKIKIVESMGTKAGRRDRVIRGVVHQFGYDPLDVHFLLTSTGKQMSRGFRQVEIDND